MNFNCWVVFHDFVNQLETVPGNEFYKIVHVLEHNFIKHLGTGRIFIFHLRCLLLSIVVLFHNYV